VPREITPGSAAARALPRIVIAGRPNAGKSSLFNRLLRRRKAVVDATPGVTRDVNEAVAVFDDRAVLLVDTGGFEGDATGPALERAVRDAAGHGSVVGLVLNRRDAILRPSAIADEPGAAHGQVTTDRHGQRLRARR
jgi:predicted GTPase